MFKALHKLNSSKIFSCCHLVNKLFQKCLQVVFINRLAKTSHTMFFFKHFEFTQRNICMKNI
uniref:Uncharacterized protein n=1 Tax=Octopus bimaculoides TaxID=37653 RepID=A0A0L8GMZ1_OCTBM